MIFFNNYFPKLFLKILKFTFELLILLNILKILLTLDLV
jgi:hypothetical protein